MPSMDIFYSECINQLFFYSTVELKEVNGVGEEYYYIINQYYCDSI